MYIQEKKRLLEGYLELTFELEKLIESEQYEQLDEQIKKRQNIIRKVEELDSSQPSGEVEKARQALLPLLAEMIQQEAKVKGLMQESMAEIKAEMNKMSNAKKATQAYQAQSFSYDGAFFDKKIQTE